MDICSAGELTPDEIDRLLAIIANPSQFKIPLWFLNHQKERKTGVTKHISSNNLQAGLREDLERLKKIRYVTHKSFQFGFRTMRPKHQMLFLLQCSPWSSPLLGAYSAWTAHLYHWSPWCSPC